MADLQFLVDYSSLKKANQEILKTGSNAQKSARVFEQAYKKVESAQRKALSDVRSQITFSERMRKQREKESQEAVKALDRQRKAAQAYNTENQRLINKLNPLRAASQLYEKELKDINDAMARGVINDRQRQQSLDALNNEFNQFATEGKAANAMNNRFAASTNMAGRRTNQLGVLMQQTGYQVGDFAVQVQGGTNVMVALGQQATQLVGTFGMLAKSTKMIAAFAGLGILIPIITGVAGAFMRMSGEANIATDAIESFSDVTKGMAEEIKSANLELFQFAQNVNNLAVAKASLKLQDIQEQIGEVRSRIEEAQRQGAGGVLSAASLNTELRVLEKQRDSLQGQIDELNSIEEKHENVKGFITDIFNISESLDFSVANRGASFLEARLKGAAKAALDILQRTSDRIQRGREVGRGRGTMGGPTPEEIQQYDPRAQLAYAPMIETGGVSAGGGASGGSGGVDPAQEFNKAREALASLVSQYDDGVKVAQQLSKAQETVNQAVEAGVITTEQGQTAMQGYINSLDKAENPLKKIGETLKNSLGDAFMSIVDGSKSAGEAFRDMARIVLKQAFEMLVIKPILNSIFGGGGGFSLFSANGNAFEQGGKVTAYANGGVVNAPTAFQHSGGLGVMGEAGPEAIMPLKRGKNGKLGVQMEGGNQGNVTVENHFHIAANGDESVKRIIAQEAPRIANLTQKQILDQRRRGGVMKTTFA